MPHVNVEIKARCHDLAAARSTLADLGADPRGLDHQVDTYFNCPAGRLKLRQGDIETALIHYRRADQPGPKRADVTLTRLSPEQAQPLRLVLAEALGVSIVVDKHREIYFIDNVKFHLDRVEGLGEFLEIEAIDADGSRGESALQTQCGHYLTLLSVAENDLQSRSYSDMLRPGGNNRGGD